MGSVCCCLHDGYDDYVIPNNWMHRNCACLHCVLKNVLYTYISIFQRGQEHARLPSRSSIQGASSSFGSSVSLDNSLSEMYRSPPRPLPYDADPRYFRLQQQDGVVLGREKGSSHSQEEGEPLRRSDSDTDADPLYARSKWNNETKDSTTKLSFKLSTEKETTGIANVYPSSEDEDVCPTCLEEYTSDNPKIITKCSHHFHLGCIYEWMERSETCPVCGKVMAFDEAI